MLVRTNFTPCHGEHYAAMVVKSGITVDRMQGGVFTSRDISDLLHRYYKSKKGWTMLSMMLLGAFVGAGLGALRFQMGVLPAAGTQFTSAALTGAAWGAGLNLRYRGPPSYPGNWHS
jgi:hypothetical protein